MTELHDLTAVEQAAAIKARTLSPVELAEHYLSRSERLGPQVGAFIDLTPELAIEHARAAEQRILASDDVHSLPAILGVPVPIKGLHMVRGVRCTFGSAAFDVMSPIDDNVVRVLLDQGTVLTGITNTPEFGLPCYTENEIAPPARTPWDVSRSAGGSSGGAAAAVAMGLAAVAQGGDGGGSIRIPASACGLVGIKPSRGRISRGPASDGVGDLVVDGPLARTVADAALLLDAMARPFAGDPLVAEPLPVGETFVSHASREPGSLRIGRFVTPPLADCDVHPDCVDAFESASALLASLGHEVVDIAPPFTPELADTFIALWSTLAALAPVPPELEPQLLPLTRWLRQRGAGVTGVELGRAVAVLRSTSRTWLESTAEFDAILTPTLAQPPALIGSLRNDDDPAADFQAQTHFTPYTAAYNMTGQPAVSLPLHWTAAGLPIGVQLAGRRGEEATLISLAGQLERARPWAHRRPAGW